MVEFKEKGTGHFTTVLEGLAGQVKLPMEDGKFKFRKVKAMNCKRRTIRQSQLYNLLVYTVFWNMQ